MSKIALSPNASGSAVFTIAAPNSNSDRTLDLPDSAGTIATAESTLAQFNASGSAPVYACRAWVNFNGTNTVAIRASGNVSSITDNGTGLYTVNFTTAIADANYNAVYGGMEDDASASVGYYVGILTAGGAITSKTTTALRIHCKNQSDSSADGVDINVSIFR